MKTSFVLFCLPIMVLCGDFKFSPEPLPTTPATNTTTPMPPPTNTTTSTPASTNTTTSTPAPTNTTTSTPAPTNTTTQTPPTPMPHPTTKPTTHAPNITTPTPPSTNGTTPTPPSTNGTTPTPPSTNGTTPTPPSTNGTTPTPPPSANTTTPTPSTSTTPAPVPEPTMGKWTVKNGTSNVTCVIVNMAIQVNVTYNKTDNKIGFAVLDIPKNASNNGSCGSEKQNLTLQWLHKNDTNYPNVLEMIFEKNVQQKKFVLQDITLRLAVNPDNFPNANKNISNITLHHNGTLFSTPLSRSYKCMKTQEVSMFRYNSNKTVGTLTVSHVQLEAFHETNSTEFGAIEDCERSTDIVPITVGCALVGLVAVVLIGYLVGRRRSQARGYLSM